MREGWVEKKLGNLCVVLDSQRKPVAKINRKKGIFPYYGANGLLDYVDDYIFEGKYVLLGEDGANWDNNASSSYIVDGKIWVNNHAHVIKVNNLLNDEYLVYYLNYKDLNKYISGAIIKKLTQSSLKEINIEYPDLSFQEKIVSELDKISEMISKYDEQLKELDKLSQSIFYEMFGDPVENEKGWEVSSVENVCSSIVRGPFGSALKKEFFVEPNSNTYKNMAGPTGPASLLPLELIAKERLCYKCNNLILLHKFSLLRIYGNIFAACKCLNLLITIVGLYAAYYITLLNRSAYNRSC